MKKGTLFALLMILIVISFVACSDKEDDPITFTLTDNTGITGTKQVYVVTPGAYYEYGQTNGTITSGQSRTITIPEVGSYEIRIQGEVSEEGGTRLARFTVTKDIEKGDEVNIFVSDRDAHPEVGIFNNTGKILNLVRIYHYGKIGVSTSIVDEPTIAGQISTGAMSTRWYTIKNLELNNEYDVYARDVDGNIYHVLCVDMDVIKNDNPPYRFEINETHLIPDAI